MRKAIFISIVFLVLIPLLIYYLITMFQDRNNQANQNFTISSPAFSNQGNIPVKYCNTSVSGGENVSIPVQWNNTPEGTKSFLLVIVDTHQVANNWLHWVVKDIPANVNGMPEGASNSAKLPVGAIELTNTSGIEGYSGPQPPIGSGTHPYEIHLFALNTEKVELHGPLTWESIQEASANKAIAETKITGMFGR
jgi:Raf kinase inhibitor-like YbhB/YbcL family protein